MLGLRHAPGGYFATHGFRHRCSKKRGCKLRAGDGKWDLGRFIRTIVFFNPPPSISSIAELIQRAWAPRDLENMSSAGKKWILVTGATGGVGARVVAKLLSEGKHVRALVRDPRKAQTLPGSLPRAGTARLEIVTADLIRAETLREAYFQDVAAIISASATTVVPKEGDTPERQKYRQGIKFYEPVIQGSSPKEVEYESILRLLSLAQKQLRGEGTVIFDPLAQDVRATWGALDDVVMGGLSQSSFTKLESEVYAVFSGQVLSTNNGGFASVRTKNFEPFLNLSHCRALRLRVKGDGLRYKMSVRTDTKWDGVGYTQSFDTQPNVWQDVDLPFHRFVPVFRAKLKPNVLPFDAARIASIQLMLSKFEYDGALNPKFRLGPFALPVARIVGVVADAEAPLFIHVSSAGVTRPGKPGLDLNKEPPAVRMNEALGGLLTWKLAGEDAIRGSGINYTIVRPVALTEEPAGADLEIGQGDTLKGKISRLQPPRFPKKVLSLQKEHL